MAETKNEAVAALDAFAESYAPKYDKAIEDLDKAIKLNPESIARFNDAAKMVARAGWRAEVHATGSLFIDQEG